MLRSSQLRISIIGVALTALLILSACTFTVQPETETGGTAPASQENQEAQESQGSSGTSEASAIAEFVLPDGTSCLYADTGISVEFDGKSATYTCESVDATDPDTTSLAILNDPVVVGPTEYAVDLATVGQTEGGFELHSSEVITFTAWEVELADGRVCLHAGFGATMGFEGQRLNYTCDLDGSTADEVGLMGELVNQGNGVWVAQIDEIGSDASGFTQLSSNQVEVARISGVTVTPDAAPAEAAAEATDMADGLVGTTWQWVQTVYGDDSVVAADDPSRYTLHFAADGQLAVRLDCNGGGGTYTVDGSSLLFGAIVSTRMACPDGSQADVFSKDLAEVYSYVIEDGRLYLSLKLDSGIMEFEQVEQETGTPTAEATEEATAEVTPEATEEATVEATEEPTAEVTDEATIEPTAEPTGEPTEEATVEPTAEATEEPTEEVTPEATEEVTAEPTEEATEEATTEPTEEAAGAGSDELAGTTWQWVRTIYEGDMVVLSSDPTRYTLTFNEDGTVGVQLDCNSGGGPYTVDGSDLTFGPIVSTLMACPAGSQDAIFSEDLAAVTSYVLADGNLHLTLSTDGVMEFEPVE